MKLIQLNEAMDNELEEYAALDALSKKLIRKYKLSELRMHFSTHGDIYLSLISVPKESREQGIGSKVMQELTNYADSIGKRIILTLATKDDAFGTTSENRLRKFYKRFGFVDNKGRNKDYRVSASMIYRPKGYEKY